MKISDAAMDRLRKVGDLPDLRGLRYEVLRKLDEGGMGSIFLAVDSELGREVVLKVLRQPESSDRLKERLIQEARVIAGLEHPGIVPIHDVGMLPDGRAYYVMKYVRGQRLDRFAESGHEAHLLRVFERICETVAFAHSRGVIHRDLKPQNIMIGAFGEVLVLDWGVAKVMGTRVSGNMGEWLTGERPRTLCGTVMGTPGYMAPEQLRGEVDSVDERTDVYGLGAILHFLLTRRHPNVDERRPLGAAGHLQDGSPQGAIGWPVPVHPSLVAICEKALAPEKARRYSSVPSLASDVRRFLSQLPVQARPERLATRARRLLVKYRTPILLVVAYLLMRVLFLLHSG